MKKLTEEQIWEIIDGDASPELIKIHEALLKENDAYCSEFNECLSLEKQLVKLDLEMPSMRFAENVLDKVLPQTVVKTDRTPLYFLIFTASIAVIGFIIMTMGGNDNAANNLFVNTEGATSILSNPVITSSFWIVNALLFFIILDKKVFKPFFQKRLKN